MDATDYVLQRFRKDELQVMDAAIPRAARGVELWIRDGIDAAMNATNPEA
jgi:peptidyl-tRNA hydrolase